MTKIAIFPNKETNTFPIEPITNQAATPAIIPFILADFLYSPAVPYPVAPA